MTKLRTHEFFIGGEWTAPASTATLTVENPATLEVVGSIALGAKEDVDRAVASARKAFETYSKTKPEYRRELIRSVLEIYNRRASDAAAVLTSELGSPLWFSNKAQIPAGGAHLAQIIKVLDGFSFESQEGGYRQLNEPIGVCGLITPWNWPLNQILCKVAPALAAGCTMVLKPSEVTPLNAIVLAEILEEAGVPSGVFNLVHGDGLGVGNLLSAHPDVDMISITGSTRAGILVAQAAAPTVKRVHQELGGKSPSVVLDDADLKKAVTDCIRQCTFNSGQSCGAPTRLLVPKDKMRDAIEIAKQVVAGIKVGMPTEGDTAMGPVVSAQQYAKIQKLIKSGIDEGAHLATGGLERPDGLTKGYFVKATVFADVDNSMTIAREEIFGPVVSMIPYGTIDEAIAIANDTEYGLAAFVWAGDDARGLSVAREIRAGMIHLNGKGPNFGAPFGGYKRSGNGREWGVHGLKEFTETKALMGFG